MQKITPERIELDYEDIIAIENAICDRIDTLSRIIEGHGNISKTYEGICERKRLRDIYHELVCNKLVIERSCNDDA